jgi:hypothetical protein
MTLVAGIFDMVRLFLICRIIFDVILYRRLVEYPGTLTHISSYPPGCSLFDEQFGGTVELLNDCV